MLPLTILLIILALITFGLIRFGAPAEANSLALARTLIGTGLIALMVAIITLAAWGIRNQQQAFSQLSPITSLEAFTAAEADTSPFNRFVLIEGRISPEMTTQRYDYVAYLRYPKQGNDPADTTDSTFAYPSRFLIDLTGSGTVDADTSFVEQGDDTRAGYHNWPRIEEGLYYVNYLEHGTPVMVIGNPAIQDITTESGPETAYRLSQTQMMFSGTAAEFDELVRPVLQRRAWLALGLTIAAGFVLAWLVISAVSLFSRINQDPDFVWNRQEIFANVQIK